MQWVAVIDGHPTSNVFYGPLDQTLDPLVWNQNGVDFNGDPWSASVTIELAPAPITLDLVLNWNPAGHWNSNTPVAGWDGSYPFTSQLGDLLDPLSIPVGSWYVELFSATP